MPTVLVVDDDRAIRELLRFALEGEGYDVIALSDGSHVVDTLAALSEPCVVLMDLMMPCTDGWAVCAALEHAAPEFVRHPIVVMSAGLLDGDDYPAPARAFLRKPFELDTMFALVASLTLAAAAEAGVPPPPTTSMECAVEHGLAS